MFTDYRHKDTYQVMAFTHDTHTDTDWFTHVTHRNTDWVMTFAHEAHKDTDWVMTLCMIHTGIQSGS